MHVGYVFPSIFVLNLPRYTGTELCGDRERELITVFLTNRVYPTYLNIKIEHVRQLFGTAVVNAFDQKHNPSKIGKYQKFKQTVHQKA
jgi:hypothetical protein